MPTIADIRQQYPQYNDMSDQQLADALYQKHYSDMPREQYDAKIGMAKQPETATLGHKIGATIDGVAQGMTFGFSDEIAAGLGSGFGMLGDYQQKLEQERARMAENKRLAGGYELAGELGGGLATAGGLAKSGITALGRGLGAKAAIAEGAAYGGAYGAGTANEGERLSGALIGAATGAATAGVLNAVGKAGSNVLQRFKGNKAQQIMDSDALRQQASSLYDEAHSLGVGIKPKAMQKMAANMTVSLGKRTPAREKLYRETYDMVDFINESAKNGKSFSLKDFDEIRQVLNDTISDAPKREQRTLIAIKNQMDNFMDNLSPAQATGDIKRAGQVLGNARQMYSRFAKQEIVDEIFNKAMNQATGFENGLRVHFRSLANNPKKMARFSPEEQDAIRKIVRGGPVENALRAFAWFSPQKTLGAVTSGLTMAEGGIGPASLMGGAGYLSSKAAEKATMGNVKELQRILQGIQNPPMKTLPSPVTDAAIRVGSGQAGALAVQ